MNFDQTIPYDDISSLEINIVSGMKKEIPLTFTKTVDGVTSNVILANYASIRLNVFDVSGSTAVTALSRNTIDDPSLIYLGTANNELIIVFKSETGVYKNNKFYFNIEFVLANDPSEYYIQGRINIMDKINFLPNIITNKV